MRFLLLASALLLLPVPASALCRCTCIQGKSVPICQQTDLIEPICQDLCVDSVRPVQVVRPLAGGKPEFGPVLPSNPSPGTLVSPQQNLDQDANGQPLGTPSILSGGIGSTLSGGASIPTASGSAGGLGVR